jgi:hypothetical protein
MRFQVRRGNPAFDLCQLGRNMGFGMEKINENPRSDSPPIPHLNRDLPQLLTVRRVRESRVFCKWESIVVPVIMRGAPP